MCTCVSMPPGIRVIPLRSTSTCGGCSSIFTIFEPSTTTAALANEWLRPSSTRSARITVAPDANVASRSVRAVVYTIRMAQVIMMISLLALLFAAQIQPNNLVIPIGGAPQILIPAAGAIQGANGTFFRSDIALVNYAAHDQLVQLRWLPQGATGTGIVAREITIPAHSGIV